MFSDTSKPKHSLYDSSADTSLYHVSKILYGSPETSLSKYRHFYTLFGDLSHLIRNCWAKNFIGYNHTKFILSTICWLRKNSWNLKYLVVIMRNDLSWFDCIIYTNQKAFSAMHFVMRIVEMGNIYTKILPTRH